MIFATGTEDGQGLRENLNPVADKSTQRPHPESDAKDGAEHERLINGLDASQQQAWQGTTSGNMNQLRQQLNLHQQQLDDELKGNPDCHGASPKELGRWTRTNERLEEAIRHSLFPSRVLIPAQAIASSHCRKIQPGNDLLSIAANARHRITIS